MSKEAKVSERTIKTTQIEVLSIAEGFFKSDILFALLKLKIFELIDKESRTLDELAAELKVRPETLSRLLNAGVALGLLESKDGLEFCIATKYRIVLAPSAGDYYLGDLISSLDYFGAGFEKLDEAVLNSGPTIDTSAHIGGNQDSTREFILGFHNYALLRGKELAHFLDTAGCKSLLDLGCGPGTYAFQLGMKNPDLALYLLDLPEVLEITKGVQASFPLKNEIHYLPMDAIKSDVPGSYDMVLVSNMLVGLSEEDSRALVRRLYDSVNPGGSLVIQAQFLHDDRLGPEWPVILDLMMLCSTQDGRNHAPEETVTWLNEAGFKETEFCSMSFFNTNSFLRGYKV
jgi:SAM-dependent methyltransferase